MGELDFPKQLINTDLRALKVNQKQVFRKYEESLTGMRFELADKPDSNNLIKLHESQKKGRAFYERSLEIYREYLKYYSNVVMLKNKAENLYQEALGRAMRYCLENYKEDMKALKGAAEREAYAKTFIPVSLKEEVEQWEILESEAKVNFSVIKSYVEQFKSIRDEILVQLSIIKNLIALGGIKISPEALRVFQTIDSAVKPSREDIAAKGEVEGAEYKELSINEGIVSLDS